MRSILICSAFAALFMGPPAPSSPVFTVGVLRRDATIVPFATYDGADWKDAWPEPDDRVEVPVNVRSVPRKWWGPSAPLDQWQVWAGPAPQMVHVRQPDWLVTHCQKQVGLRTDYQPREFPPGPDVQPYPKDGLAISPAHPVQPVERISPDSEEGKAVAAFVQTGFNARQDAAVMEAAREGADVRPTRAELEKLPITIESIYATGSSWRAYYVESTREYKKTRTPQHDDTCAILFGSGWAVLDGGKVAFAAFEVRMVPCERQGLEYMLPLGVISLPRGLFWVAQWSGFDSEQYGILEIRRNAVLKTLAVWGGGC